LNIASLLQKLDIDGNPDNGINLGNDDQKLEDSRLDIGAFKATDFVASSNIASIREQLGLTGSVRSLQQNVAHLYDSLGIEVQADNIAQSAQKSGSTQTQNTYFEYDDSGRLISERTENQSGGEDFVVSYSYDEDGRIKEKTNTRQQLRETFTYSDSGKITSRNAFRNNGSDSSESYTYQNDELVSFSYDDGNDGSIDQLTLYDRPVANQVTTRIYNNGDSSSTPSTVIEETYFPDDLLAVYSDDKNNDGTPDLIVSYSYDAQENKSVFSVPINDQGSATSYDEFEYSGDLVIKYIKYLNGQIVYQERYTYDPNNNRTSVDKDMNGDGSFNQFAQYRYDSSSNRISSAEDFNGDGIAD